MKSKLIFLALAVLLLLPIGPTAQELKESPLQAIVMGSGWTDDGFTTGLSGGIKAGFQMPMDTDRGLWLRTLYSRYNFHPEETGESISLAVLMDWYIGKSWKFYFDVGPEFHLDGPLTGTDYFSSIGVMRRMWTSNSAKFSVPAHLDMFAEISFNDGSGQFAGDYLQLNIGFKFGRPTISQ